MEQYDAIVIGAGQGGAPLARIWAEAGRRVALVERLHVGGTCANTGCTPTKAMAASARTAYLTRRAADFGVHCGSSVTVNMKQVKDRAQAIVQDFRTSGEKSLLNAGVDLIYGQARFEHAQEISVSLKDGAQRQITAEQIFINVGARVSLPVFKGLDETPFLDYVSLQQLESVPDHLLVLGGGYIALEFAQMFRRFGSEVTVIEQANTLIAHEDADVVDAMTDILREDGIHICTGSQAIQVCQTGNNLSLRIQQADKTETTLTGSHLLVATGRMPNTDDLGLEKAGVEVDERNFVKTNSRLETNISGIYALGDCKGGPQFTHIAYDDFRILKANLLDGKNRDTQDRLVPYTVFTDPQLGRVGLTEREARAAGHQVKVAKLPMTEAARTIETGETRGFLKAIVDGKTDLLLGCAMLCVNGGEIMAVFQMAMQGKIPYPDLRDGVFAHPTLAESLNNLFMTLD